MAGRRLQRKKAYQIGVGAMILSVVAAFVTRALDDGSGPWWWIGVAVQVVAAITLVVCLVSIVRGQRDDYRKEPAHDPRDPGRSTL